MHSAPCFEISCQLGVPMKQYVNQCIKKIYNDNDDDNTPIMKTMEIYEALITQKERKTYIGFYGEIPEILYMTPIINRLRDAKPNEKIVLEINSDGGNMDAGIQLCNTILDTPAYVIANIYNACSAAALIALCCDCIVIKKFGTMMFHVVKWSISGKIDDMTRGVTYMNRLNYQMTKELTKGFLTEEEQSLCLETGGDVWLIEEDLVPRLKTWTPYKKRKIMKNQKNK